MGLVLQSTNNNKSTEDFSNYDAARRRILPWYYIAYEKGCRLAGKILRIQLYVHDHFLTQQKLSLCNLNCSPSEVKKLRLLITLISGTVLIVVLVTEVLALSFNIASWPLPLLFLVLLLLSIALLSSETVWNINFLASLAANRIRENLLHMIYLVFAKAKAGETDLTQILIDIVPLLDQRSQLDCIRMIRKARELKKESFKPFFDYLRNIKDVDSNPSRICLLAESFLRAYLRKRNTLYLDIGMRQLFKHSLGQSFAYTRNHYWWPIGLVTLISTYVFFAVTSTGIGTLFGLDLSVLHTLFPCYILPMTTMFWAKHHQDKRRPASAPLLQFLKKEPSSVSVKPTIPLMMVNPFYVLLVLSFPFVITGLISFFEIPNVIFACVVIALTIGATLAAWSSVTRWGIHHKYSKYPQDIFDMEYQEYAVSLQRALSTKHLNCLKYFRIASTAFTGCFILIALILTDMVIGLSFSLREIYGEKFFLLLAKENFNLVVESILALFGFVGLQIFWLEMLFPGRALKKEHFGSALVEGSQFLTKLGRLLFLFIILAVSVCFAIKAAGGPSAIGKTKEQIGKNCIETTKDFIEKSMKEKDKKSEERKKAISKDIRDMALCYCEEIEDKLKRDECYSEVAWIFFDPEICECIESDNRRDSCYCIFLIREKQDFSVCEKITNPYLKKSCLELRRLHTISGQI